MPTRFATSHSVSILCTSESERNLFHREEKGAKGINDDSASSRKRKKFDIHTLEHGMTKYSTLIGPLRESISL